MNPVRRLPTAERALYLTFDDGPDSKCTPAVLDLLKRHQAQATFFVVTKRAEQFPNLIARIRDEGHTLGNHSLDHKYRNFFKRGARLSDWLTAAESRLRSLNAGHPSVGFRPPAGIVTPPLRKVLSELGEPVILWNTRFYDALRPWTAPTAIASLRRAQPGDIVLLHDRQRSRNQDGFLRTLDLYLTTAKAMGFKFGSLSRDACAKAMT